jgi:SAM-dependent methyltransferase
MHLNSELLFKKYAKTYFKDCVKVLEIGPDAIPSSLSTMIGNPTIEWHTLNIEAGERTSNAKNEDLHILAADEYNYPIVDDTYDIIISANVLEHVRKFWVWFPELKRILKPGGHIITISPISWPYHEAPVDCWRIYPEGMAALYEEVGLINVLTIFESLEKEKFKDQPYTPLFPWASTSNEKKIKYIKWYNRILSIFPFTKPIRAGITVSYDQISIASK